MLSLDGTLDENEQYKRTLFLGLHCATLIAQTIAMFVADVSPVMQISTLMALATAMFSILWVLCRCKVTNTVVAYVAYTHLASIMLVDWHSRARGSSVVGIFVLVVDFLLVMQVDAYHTLLVVSISCGWICLAAVESYFRFGLFDLPGLAPQHGQYSRWEKYTEEGACTDLPCPDASAWGFMMGSLQIFVVDFIATRGFAREVLKEQATMQKTINTVQEIASLLAGYDVERVAELLAEHEGQLPEEMTSALRSLEENLRAYRPYLPAALFEKEDGVQYTSVAPPGLDSETATIVFTDIRASTSIWESAPDGMRAGLSIHNAVIREVMRMCGGYEVKTIGDAFMLAFPTTGDGVSFGLRVQECLLEADWPASLLEDAPICSRQGSLWCGLTVRIGVNSGPVTVEQNTLTGRTDYFGHTVNVASRLESTCTPGAVAIPSDLWAAECGSCSAVVGATEAVHLKGVSGCMSVCCVWPVSLGGRKKSPLCNNFASDVRSVGSESQKSSHLGTVIGIDATQQVSGTIGVAELAVGDVGEQIALHNVSSGLATLTIILEQSGGSLVTLLGNCVCVGWNVSRSAPAHVENAIRFAQRMFVRSTVNGVGLASGRVHHGAVGARKQRFVTVMGQIVRRSWTLCEEAVRDGPMCLYESPQGTTLPSALEDVLLPYKGCYRVVQPTPADNREKSTPCN